MLDTICWHTLAIDDGFCVYAEYSLVAPSPTPILDALVKLNLEELPQ